MGFVIMLYAMGVFAVLFFIVNFWSYISAFFKWIIKPYRLIIFIIILIGLVALFLYGNRNAGKPTKTNRNDSSYNDTTTHNNQTQQSHECYVCGDEANLKYGSHYYCNTHWAMVKTIVEAD